MMAGVDAQSSQDIETIKKNVMYDVILKYMQVGTKAFQKQVLAILNVEKSHTLPIKILLKKKWN